MAKLTKAPIAIEIVRRIDELFAIERDINGKPPNERRAARQDRSKPLVAALEGYMREQYERLSPKNAVAKAIRYMLVRWGSFTRFLDDGRICLATTPPSAPCAAWRWAPQLDFRRFRRRGTSGRRRLFTDDDLQAQ